MVSALLDRLTHARMPVADAAVAAAKIKCIEAATFTARSLVYYENVSELPDHVKQHPLRAQRAFLLTYKNVLKRWGDYGKAMRAAEKALHVTALKLRAAEQDAADHSREIDTDVVGFHVKRVFQGPRVQIVIP